MRGSNDIPRIYIDPDLLTKTDIDLVLKSKYDEFYRRIVEYTLAVIEGGEGGILAIIVDDDDVEYEMTLPYHGFEKSLTKTIEYFELIEEYETCELIKQIIKKL